MVNNFTLSEINDRNAQNTLELLPYLNRTTLSAVIGKKGDSLNYWVKRLIKSRDIIPLKKGLFVSRAFLLKIKGQPLLLDNYREYLAGLLRSPSYISLEYALAKYGALTEVPFAITSITNKSPRIFTNEFGSFVFRNIKRSLFNGYREEYFGDKRYYIATQAKALFDFIYLRKFQRCGFERIIEEGLRINWDAFKKTDLEELRLYVGQSKRKKMEKFTEIIVKGDLI